MTRRHYELIAQALYNTRPRMPDRPDYHAGYANAAAAIANALAADNPRFDRTRFLEAAGVAS